MKKYLAVIALVLLVIWGIYDISSNKESNNMETSLVGAEGNNELSVSSNSIGLGRGDLAPDFELKSLEDTAYKLSDFKGKNVIVNFWSTGCPPCRQEMPDMEKFYLKYKNEVEILAVNLVQNEKRKADVPDFIKANNITFPVLLDEHSDAARLYNVYWIPASFILDSEGVIREKIEGPMTYEWLEKTLNTLNE
ncbi:MAG: TlpA family protein disulfide reductase [Desulfitobacterium sp.]|nr:TlpA family protein disulfide reductase [Desulfitobacterium sp.]